MDIAIFTQAAQLGGTVFTVVAFLWYLSKLINIQTAKDKMQAKALIRQADSNILLAKSLQSLTDIVNKNIISISQSKASVDENTGAVAENTKKIIENGTH